ncbi:hypothetical protein D9758_012255 [Tetrapyrgos nigripes]|uniref:Hypervirulence associated protein TUDOR domain-containing protein n=1 Tax=Tetrapyrgos nigripes TaxID=182062 RepID=A0A8H5CI03_9AGAR|nr:hypothetical protein D9758_012255 [Tetrapyrgos nigripes]
MNFKPAFPTSNSSDNIIYTSKPSIIMSPSTNKANKASNPEYEVGDHVEYQAIGGGNVPNSTTTGEITDVVDSKAPAGDTGNRVNASASDPRYVIQNDNTGKETAYKAKNITGIVETE